MTTQTQDLWGDLKLDGTPTPSMLLKQQATLLGQKTKHALEAEVRTWASGSRFYHAFDLVVPALDNYTYELFRISHEVGLYPVETKSESFETEDEFKKWIQQQLSSAETKRIVTNLLSMARS